MHDIECDSQWAKLLRFSSTHYDVMRNIFGTFVPLHVWQWLTEIGPPYNAHHETNRGELARRLNSPQHLGDCVLVFCENKKEWPRRRRHRDQEEERDPHTHEGDQLAGSARDPSKSARVRLTSKTSPPPADADDVKEESSASSDDEKELLASQTSSVRCKDIKEKPDEGREKPKSLDDKQDKKSETRKRQSNEHVIVNELLRR